MKLTFRDQYMLMKYVLLFFGSIVPYPLFPMVAIEKGK